MRQIGRVILESAVLLLLASAAGAQGARPLAKCAPGAVVSGTVCMDRYEASVWRVENPTTDNASLVAKIQQGKVTHADLIEAAQQLGSGGDYGLCLEDGQACADIFAVSLAGVPPSANTTWFQAQQACKNSRKRLPTSAEWQAAVAGTPDPGADNNTSTCNTTSGTKVSAGTRTLCVSFDGAFDMVGNVREWVADWVPLSTGCGDWPSSISANDDQCLSGASVVPTDEPGALLRGGDFNDGTAAGPFAVDGRFSPSAGSFEIGFRCAR